MIEKNVNAWGLGLVKHVLDVSSRRRNSRRYAMQVIRYATCGASCAWQNPLGVLAGATELSHAYVRRS